MLMYDVIKGSSGFLQVGMYVAILWCHRSYMYDIGGGNGGLWGGYYY